MRRLAMARSGEAGSEEDDEATSMAGSQFGAIAARSQRLPSSTRFEFKRALLDSHADTCCANSIIAVLELNEKAVPFMGQRNRLRNRVALPNGTRQ
jgi:hypothetical protein